MERYENRMEYRKDVLAYVKKMLTVYDAFTGKSIFDRNPYRGNDSVPWQVERKRILTEVYPPEELEEYDKKCRQILKLQTEYAKKAAASAEQGMIIPLEYLFYIFRAEGFLRHCVMLALAPELDVAFGRLYALFPENLGLAEPTLDFCIRTYTPWEEERQELLEEVSRNRRVYALFFGSGIGRLERLLEREMKLEERILLFLFHMEEDDPDIRSFCRIAYTEELDEIPMVTGEHLAERLAECASEPDRAGCIYYIYGPSGSGRRFLVRHVHRRMKKLCLMVDARGLTEDTEHKKLDRVLREALIRQAGLCIWNMEKLWEEGEFENISMLRRIFEYLPSVFLIAEEKWRYGKEGLPGAMQELEMQEPSPKEQILLWEAALGRQTGAAKEVFHPEILSVKFSFTPGQIEDSVREAAQLADWRQEPLSEELLYEACRRQVSHHMRDRAVWIKAAYDWNDLILPKRQKQILRDACNQITYYHMVYEKWGFRQKMAYGGGVSLLFCGPPGTGKTMGAQVIAKELGLELYKVDLSAVMSKYIGETEKNLGDIFGEAKKSRSILFFDEADALFSRRTEVKDANDKFANAQTAYLLQKIEEYEGIVILATNYLQNFDEAFKRRIKFIIEFSLPDGVRRLAIWRSVFSESVPLSGDIDYEYLAEQFELSGSSIKNIAVASAFLAAAEGTEVHMQHILCALWEEMKKSGKLLRREDFGEYGDWMCDFNERRDGSDTDGR